MRLHIEICEAAYQKLVARAVMNRRHTRDEAAVLLEQALGVRPIEYDSPPDLVALTTQAQQSESRERD